MTKLEWCKANAPEVLKGESDEVILESMNDAFQRFCDGDGNGRYLVKHMSLREMCDTFTDMWVYLDNIEYSPTGIIQYADVVAAYDGHHKGEGYRKRTRLKDFEFKLYMDEAVINFE